MQYNPLAILSVQQLKQALSIREQISRLEGQLDRITGGRRTTGKRPASGRKGKRSAAAKARISAAMKARSAKKKRLASRFQPATMTSRLVGLRAKKPTPKAPLKERVIRSLKAAGASGVAVKDLAAKLGTSYGNISVWFHTTAKRVKEIKKVAPGRFAWVSSARGHP